MKANGKNKILIVEDDVLLRRGISLALEMQSFEVIQAGNGAEGMEVLQQSMPDLILSDINMPIMDGLQFRERVRSNAAWTQIPFVFLTGNDDAGAIQAGHEMGVEDYITKPIQSENLLRIINARLLRAAEVRAAFLDEAFLQTVLVLANTIESRDHYTHGHVDRVARYAAWFCEALDWSQELRRATEYGARLHDIGKITIPDQILNKPDKLTANEWVLMKKHPEAGVHIIENIPMLKIAVPYILFHHEKWNGTGYPVGLAGDSIPVEGRMLAVVDVFDALTTDRPYRKALEIDEAAAFISSQAGREFDPHLVPVFLNEVLPRIRTSFTR